MKKSFLSLLFIIPLLVTCSNFTEAQAAEGDVGYSVQAHIPANQIDKRQTYFDLKMQPKQKQTVNIDVMNSSNEEIQVERQSTTHPPIELVSLITPKMILRKKIKV